jgi:hypothetical protein
MTTAGIAALIAVLAWGFIEGLRRFYPSRETWRRLRRRRGVRAVRAMRERFETAGARKAPGRLLELLIGAVVVWIAAASWLDKHWHEVAVDVLPYVFVLAAIVRTPGSLFAVGERMREYEKEVGEDPDADPDEDEQEGPAEWVL